MTERYIEGDLSERRRKAFDIIEIQKIIDEEAHAMLKKSPYLEREREDMKQAAWVAIAEAHEQIEKAEPLGAYVRKVARYAMRGYIRTLRRDAMGHRG